MWLNSSHPTSRKYNALDSAIARWRCISCIRSTRVITQSRRPQLVHNKQWLSFNPKNWRRDGLLLSGYRPQYCSTFRQYIYTTSCVVVFYCTILLLIVSIVIYVQHCIADLYNRLKTAGGCRRSSYLRNLLGIFMDTLDTSA